MSRYRGSGAQTYRTTTRWSKCVCRNCEEVTTVQVKSFSGVSSRDAHDPANPRARQHSERTQHTICLWALQDSPCSQIPLNDESWSWDLTTGLVLKSPHFQGQPPLQTRNEISGGIKIPLTNRVPQQDRGSSRCPRHPPKSRKSRKSPKIPKIPKSHENPGFRDHASGWFTFAPPSATYPLPRSATRKQC